MPGMSAVGADDPVDLDDHPDGDGDGWRPAPDADRADAGEGVPRRGARWQALERWPDGAPRWLRGPGALVLAAALSAAVVGALIAHQGRAVVEQRVAERTAVLSLTASSVEITGMFEGFPDASRETSPDLRLTLVNRGEAAVEVQVTGYFAPERVSPGSPEPVVVGPGLTEVVRMPLDVDCAAVPPVPPGDPAQFDDRPSEWVAAVLDGGEEVRLPVTPASSGTWQLSYDIGVMCDPSAGRTVSATLVKVQPDGSLVVQVDNYRAAPMHLVPLDAPTSGVTLTADPPFPTALRPEAVTEVTLRLQVDCAQVGSVLDLPYTVDLLASADTGNPTAEGGGFPVTDPLAMGAWAASQVTAQCGPAAGASAP